MSTEGLTISGVCDAPDSSQQCVVDQQRATVAHQNREELVLDRGQSDLSAVPPKQPRREVDSRPVVQQQRPILVCSRPVHVRPHSGYKLAGAERLGDVVIRARVKRSYNPNFV
jgi:hypothetical protein